MRFSFRRRKVLWRYVIFLFFFHLKFFLKLIVAIVKNLQCSKKFLKPSISQYPLVYYFNHITNYSTLEKKYTYACILGSAWVILIQTFCIFYTQADDWLIWHNLQSRIIYVTCLTPELLLLIYVHTWFFRLEQWPRLHMHFVINCEKNMNQTHLIARSLMHSCLQS